MATREIAEGISVATGLIAFPVLLTGAGAEMASPLIAQFSEATQSVVKASSVLSAPLVTAALLYPLYRM